MESFIVLCSIATVILVIYYYLTSTFDFWKSRGVPGPRPKLIFGTMKDVILLKQFIGDCLRDVYNEYKSEPMVGIFSMREPVLVINHAELIKSVLIKDFSKFAHRGLGTYEKMDPLTQHLVTLEPKRWRSLRTRLSPVFTSGKLKHMFSLISECADHFERYAEELANKSEPVDFRELTAKYTTDVIGTCVFGIEMDALSDEESEFRKMGRQIFYPSWIYMLQLRLRLSFPWLCTMLTSILPYRQTTRFFMRIFAETMDYREKHNVVRQDFIDVLREMKKHPEKMPGVTLTDNFLASQAFVFFFAGFETSAAAMSNALYELALNQKVQDKLREEIDQAYTKHGSTVTYDIVKSMPYLDQIFKETLRKYPPLTILLRQSTEAHTFNDTSITIPKNQKVWIPIYAIHRDPDIYPDPDVFDPERFNEETSKNINPMLYLPFGDGPRNCIGARFAIFQTKVGLIKLLRNYKVEACEKTRPYVNHPQGLLLSPVDGIYLRLTKVNRS